MAEGYRWRDTHALEQLAWAVSRFLLPFSKEPITVDQLLGRTSASMPDENAAVGRLLGMPPTEEGYETVMAKIAARRAEEVHG